MFERSDRLKELFKEEISRVLRTVKDPGLCGFLTMTDLSLSADKKTASVYYSIIGTPRQRQSTAKALERASPYIRQVLRKRLSLKTIPQFVFVYDETPQKASRIDKLLLEIKKESSD